MIYIDVEVIYIQYMYADFSLQRINSLIYAINPSSSSPSFNDEPLKLGNHSAMFSRF